MCSELEKFDYILKSCDSVTTFWKVVSMKDEIMSSDDFEHVYEEIDALIKRKKVMLNGLLMMRWFLYIGELGKDYLKK